MTKEVLEYCIRGIIQYLDGDVEQFNKHVEKAMELDERTCICGGQTIPCRYNKRYSRICTDCGLIWRGKNIIQRCWVNSRRVG